MKRIIIGLSVGIVAGSATTYLLMPNISTLYQQPPSRPPIQDVPKMSVEAADTHRKDAYTQLQTIEEILALPTDFAQTEALYILAGRSDARAVQDLIYQANQIANPVDRRGALRILFSRLTTLDPPSALALANTRNYSSNSQLKAMIWGEWSKNDFDSALTAAARLESDAHRNTAAQGMYAAHGFAGNDRIAVIEDTLGVPLNRNTRAQHLYSIASRSPVEAIAYVESQAPQHQYTLAYWLADFLGRTNPESAQRLADLFESRRNRDIYLQTIASASAQSNPEAALEMALAQGGNQRQRMQARAALGQLAAQDPDKAITYMARARNREERRMFAMIIAQGLAQYNPDRALQWALENDDGGGQQVYLTVLSVIAHENPQRALDAAVGIKNMTKRRLALQSLFSTVSQNDPMLAIRYLNQIDNKEIKRSATSNIVQNWARADPDAAIDWVLTREGVDQRMLLSQVSLSVVHVDARAAMRLLPRLDDQSAANLRVQIVSRLASEGSLADARSFLSQHEGRQEYGEMFAALVRATAVSDFQSALQMAHSLQDGREKDQVMAELAQQRLIVDPAESIRLLALISDENQKNSATAQLAQQWQGQDERAVTNWARGLPRGPQRDSAIAGLASDWQDMTPSRKLLINSIGDLEKRRQAQVTLVYQVIQIDPDSARRLLLEFDLPEEYRQQVEATLDRQNTLRLGIGSQ